MFNFHGCNMVQANPPSNQKIERLLRLPEVESLVGMKKSAIYAGVREGTFPAPVKLSRRAVCWPLSRLEAWIAQRIELGGGTK